MDYTQLEHFPLPAFAVEQGLISASNHAALRLIPSLTPGALPPADLAQPPSSAADSGFFTDNGVDYCFTRTQVEAGLLISFSAAPLLTPTKEQQTGFLRQMRQLQGDFLVELQQLSKTIDSAPQSLAGFYQSFCRMFRMVNNLEFLWETDEGTAPFAPIALDFSALCARLCTEADGLLAESGITLTFQSKSPSLLIPGDPALLERMLLGLISNAAKGSTSDKIEVRLQRRQDRANLFVIQDGVLSSQELSSLYQAPLSSELSRPGQGAGMGISVIRQIVALHGGTLFFDQQAKRMRAVISLPTGPLPTSLTVRTPTTQRDGGLPPLLVELSDVLSPALFSMEALD